MNTLSTAFQYVDDVLSGKVITGKYVKLCVDRFVDLYDNGKDKGVIFRHDKAQHNLDFFNFIKHHKGSAALASDNRLILSPWQAFSQAYVYGFYREDTNLRLVNEVYIEVAKKNGKTTMGSGNSSFMCVGDGEPGAECFIVAPSYDQATIAYKDVKNFLGNSKFSRMCRIQAKSTAFGNSFIKPVSSDPKYLDGKFPHFALLDEVHEHKNGQIFENVKSGSIARTQPIIYMITTAGFNKESFCYQKRNSVINNLEGHFEALNVFGAIYTLDEGDDYENDEVWIKSNPQLGLSISKAKLREEVDSIKNDPERYVPVLTKNMNIWVDAPKIWISKERWEKLEFGGRELEDFRGCKAYLGLDLAISNDLTSLVAIVEKDGKEYLFSHFYIPEPRAKQFYDAKTFNFFLWKKDGHITITQGETTDYNYILNDLRRYQQIFDIQGLGCDPYNAQALAMEISQILGKYWDPEKKKTLSKFMYITQRAENISPAAKIFHRNVLDGDLLHSNNPVMNWCIRNTLMRVDNKNNWYPTKEGQNNKIDGTLSAINAKRVQMVMSGKYSDSVYNSEGIESI